MIGDGGYCKCTITSQYPQGLLQVCHQRTSPSAAGKVEMACTTCRLSWRMLQRHHFPCRVEQTNWNLIFFMKPHETSDQQEHPIIHYLDTYLNWEIMPQKVWTSCAHVPIIIFRVIFWNHLPSDLHRLPICTIFTPFSKKPQCVMVKTMRFR